MAIFDKFQQLAKDRQALLEQGIDPFNVVIKEVLSATEAIVNGRHTILAGTNNYLGLTFDPECIEAACEAARKEGTGTTGSRMANGTFSGHRQLEQELSDFFAKKHTIVFSTGYLANLGILSTVPGRDDAIIIDADCHASIYDGCRMSAAEVIRFRHNNVEDLEKRLHRLGDKAKDTLIVAEGIYSMLGDRAPLKEIVEIKKRYGAYLMVDEAHSLGVLGEQGRGLGEESGVEDSIDFIVGTFSKSLGGTGGFCASNHDELELLRYSSRPYVFTASPSPSVIASTRIALQKLKNVELRKRLMAYANKLYQRLTDLGLRIGPQPTPVIAVILRNPQEAFALWNGLLEQGVYVNLVLPPAAPNGVAMLRCSVSAAHTPEQIEHICAAFTSAAQVAMAGDAAQAAAGSS